MQVEIGAVLEGTVKNITAYGAFVELETGENEKKKPMGMIHISEVSRTYVSNIAEFLQAEQKVQVKVIGINPQGKISLSMKQLEPEKTEEKPRRGGKRPDGENRNFRKDTAKDNGEGGRPERKDRPRKPNVWEPKKRQDPSEMSFEDMMSHFKQSSEEKMCDIKRGTERRNHSRRK